MITKEQREEINKLNKEIATDSIDISGDYMGEDSVNPTYIVAYAAGRHILSEALIYFERCVTTGVLFDSDKFVSDCVNVYGPRVCKNILSHCDKDSNAFTCLDYLLKDISWEDIACAAMNVLTERGVLTDDMIKRKE